VKSLKSKATAQYREHPKKVEQENIMKFISIIKTLAASALFSSCVSLQSVSLTQIPQTRNHPVKAETSKFIIFFLSFDNDYVDKLNDDLKDQCQGGKIQGILTKDEVTNYFLGFVMKRSVTATGYCNKA
jgi:hypothetical protein